MQMKIEKMAQESRVQKAMEEQEQRFGRITRTISGSPVALALAVHITLLAPACAYAGGNATPAAHSCVAKQCNPAASCDFA